MYLYNRGFRGAQPLTMFTYSRHCTVTHVNVLKIPPTCRAPNASPRVAGSRFIRVRSTGSGQVVLVFYLIIALEHKPLSQPLYFLKSLCRRAWQSGKWPPHSPSVSYLVINLSSASCMSVCWEFLVQQLKSHAARRRRCWLLINFFYWSFILEA